MIFMLFESQYVTSY